MLKVAVFLGINCGFYASDSITIPRGSLHLIGDTPCHDYSRHKTSEKRKGILWPETVDAIKDYLAIRKAKEVSPDILFRNRSGMPYRGQSINSALPRQFNDILPTTLAGVSIGSLRHTFATVIGQSNDEEAKHVVMGHTQATIQAKLYQQKMIDETERLSALSDMVHAWLYG